MSDKDNIKVIDHTESVNCDKRHSTTNYNGTSVGTDFSFSFSGLAKIILILMLVVNLYYFLSGTGDFKGFESLLNYLSNASNSLNSFDISTWMNSLSSLSINTGLSALDNFLKILLVPVQVIVFVFNGIINLLAFVFYFIKYLFM